jgi:hypothetical protein
LVVQFWRTLYAPFPFHRDTIVLTALQMADKHDMWISKEEWEEQGKRALEKLGPRG